MTTQAQRERRPSISASTNAMRRWRRTCSSTPSSEWGDDQGVERLRTALQRLSRVISCNPLNFLQGNLRRV